MSSSTLRFHVLFSLFIAQGFAILPTLWVLPPWLAVFWLAAAAWRLQIYRGVMSFPNIYIKVLLISLSIALLVLTMKSLVSVEFFVGFFLLSFSLKLLEVEKKHDGFVLVCVGFVAIATGFLFFQSFLVALYGIFSLVLLLTIWVMLFSVADRPIAKRLMAGTALFVQVLPLMLVLFVVMPRLGPIWNMPSQSQVGQTGFSDTMSPGSFAQLIQSNDVAFRVTFETARLPSPAERYWRALVLESFDGRKWLKTQSWRNSRSRFAPANKPHPQWNIQNADNDLVRYSVLMEPHQQPWLFTLKVPVAAQEAARKLRFTPSVTLASNEKVASKKMYTVTSALGGSVMSGSLSALDTAENLQLPREGNARSKQWAQDLRSQYGQGESADRALMQAILGRFNQEFIYTLNPSAFGDDFIDTFLFERKRGFCEHYAAAFVYLLRSANIPSRVVVGYLGGELNPIENYLLVRQRDAHAWAEVWLPSTGWTRVDPTAAVAPNRVERGLSDALDLNERGLVGGATSSIALLNMLRLRLDVLNYNWQKSIVSYDSSLQQGIFNRLLGGTEIWRIALFFLGACGAIIGLVYALPFLKRPARDQYEETKYYRRHLKSLARIGFVKTSRETPLQFAHRVAESRPELSSDIIRIARVYSSLAYASRESVELKGLKLMCRQLQLKLRD